MKKKKRPPAPPAPPTPENLLDDAADPQVLAFIDQADVALEAEIAASAEGLDDAEAARRGFAASLHQSWGHVEMQLAVGKDVSRLELTPREVDALLVWKKATERLLEVLGMVWDETAGDYVFPIKEAGDDDGDAPRGDP